MRTWQTGGTLRPGERFTRLFSQRFSVLFTTVAQGFSPAGFAALKGCATRKKRKALVAELSRHVPARAITTSHCHQ